MNKERHRIILNEITKFNKKQASDLAALVVVFGYLLGYSFYNNIIILSVISFIAFVLSLLAIKKYSKNEKLEKYYRKELNKLNESKTTVVELNKSIEDKIEQLGVTSHLVYIINKER